MSDIIEGTPHEFKLLNKVKVTRLICFEFWNFINADCCELFDFCLMSCVKKSFSISPCFYKKNMLQIMSLQDGK